MAKTAVVNGETAANISHVGLVDHIVATIRALVMKLAIIDPPRPVIASDIPQRYHVRGVHLRGGHSQMAVRELNDSIIVTLAAIQQMEIVQQEYVEKGNQIKQITSIWNIGHHISYIERILVDYSDFDQPKIEKQGKQHPVVEIIVEEYSRKRIVPGDMSGRLKQTMTIGTWSVGG